MRYFDALTDKEREELTDEEVERYVALECARKGAPLSPGDPPTPPAAVSVDPDSVVYEVGNFCFINRGEADAVAALIVKQRLVNLEYGSNYSDRIIGTDAEDPPVVSPRRVFTRAEYERVKGQIAQRETAKKLYEAAKKEHEAATEARDEASRWIWEAIEVVRTRKRRRQALREKFARYLDLAEGHTGVAYNFLTQAHPDLEKEFPELREELVPPEMAKASD